MSDLHWIAQSALVALASSGVVLLGLVVWLLLTERRK
jgi:Na+-transporting NADH:ubiquinone oxidoreductase subunit NqrD